MASPFSRSRALFAAIAAVIASGKMLDPHAFGYSSRGHGRNVYSGKKRGNESGRTYPTNGDRECARRVRQMEKLHAKVVVAAVKAGTHSYIYLDEESLALGATNMVVFK